MVNKERLASISIDESAEEKSMTADLGENRELYKASMKIAMKIKRALRKAMMTQIQLAEKMNMDPAVLSRLLNGKANMELKTMLNFEKALGITIIDRTISPHSSSWRSKSSTIKTRLTTFDIPVESSYSCVDRSEFYRVSAKDRSYSTEDIPIRIVCEPYAKLK